MSRSTINYPEPMRKLHEEVRRRAIDIANQLVAKGMDENMAIITAMDFGAAWANHRSDPVDINYGQRNYKNQKENG